MPDRPAPQLAVVIPVLNGAALIEHQLAALERQRNPPPWELVVVDNGSTDGTAEVLARWQGRLPHRLLGADRRRGKAGALNVGVATTSAPLIATLDHDDEADEGYLAAVVRGLERFDLVGGRLECDSLDVDPRRRLRQPGQSTGLSEGLGFLPWVTGAALSFRRSAFERLGGFDELLGGRLAGHLPADDVDFAWRAQLEGLRVGFVPEAVVRYRMRSTARAAFSQGMRGGLCEAALFQKFGELGMPERLMSQEARRLLGIARRLPGAAPRGELAREVQLLGLVLGRLRGSLLLRPAYVRSSGRSARPPASGQRNIRRFRTEPSRKPNRFPRR